MSYNPFATVEELETFWRALNATEKSRATDLLTYASNNLRMLGRERDIDIDEEKEDELYASNLKFVVMSAVQRSMSAAEMSAGAESYTQTAGPYSENYRFANPTGDMYFTKRELKLLGLKGQVITSISTTKRDIYE